MLILAIFGLFDPFEYVIKIIIKVAQCIYAGSMGLYLCISFGGECSYMWHRSVKKIQKKVSWDPFLISQLTGLDQKVVQKL